MHILLKNSLRLKQAFYAILLLLVCLAAFFAGAAVQRAKPLPDAWVGRYRTNYFTINQDGKPGFIDGTTVYTGLSTNVNLSNTFRLKIVNGLVVDTMSNAP